MTTPQGQVPEALRLAEILEGLGWRSVDKELRTAAAELRSLHAQVAALAPAQPADGAAHVQKPAEIEHVAGDLSKNGMESNMGVAYAEMPEPDGEHHEDAAAGVGRLYSCGHYTAARLLEFGNQQFNAGREFEHERAAALRAAHGQAPAGAAREPTAFIHWPINGPPRLVWYSQKALNDAILKTYEGHQPDVKLYTAQAAPAAGAVAGPTDATRNAWQQGYAQGVASALPSKVTPDMRRVFREGYREGGFWSDRLDHALEKMLAAAPTPAAQADSVLEDAALLDWLALAGPTSICVVIDREHDGEVEVSTDDVTGYGKTLREALNAARKQGASND